MGARGADGNARGAVSQRAAGLHARGGDGMTYGANSTRDGMLRPIWQPGEWGWASDGAAGDQRGPRAINCEHGARSGATMMIRRH